VAGHAMGPREVGKARVVAAVDAIALEAANSCAPFRVSPIHHGTLERCRPTSRIVPDSITHKRKSQFEQPRAANPA
jgi:hypothetical protein